MQDDRFLEKQSFSCNAKNLSHFFSLTSFDILFFGHRIICVKEQILVLHENIQFIFNIQKYHQNSTGIQLNV